jgi:hypothetical protein
MIVTVTNKEKAMATATPTYADQRNSRFQNTQSHLVDLKQRLQDTIAALPPQAQRNWHAGLAKALKDFKRSHPKLKDFFDRSQFKLCAAQEIDAGDIMIDTTMQREPNLKWILHIISNFRAFMAQPIQVFCTPNGKWGAWDSQHTALALMLIVEKFFGLEIKDVKFPANIYDITSRADLRQLFISLNTTVGKNAGKKPLDIIDIFAQMVYGVEVDGATDPEWVAAWEKQQHIARAGMFVTAEKFNDTDQVGAISRLNELYAASVDVVRQFCVYGAFVVASQQRPINSKEIPIIIEFLNMCEQENITYSDAEIEEMAGICIDLFDANFDAKGPYWEQVHRANVNAYNASHTATQLPKHLWPAAPANLKNTPVGTAFFWHQMRQSWAANKPRSFRYPKNSFNVFVPAATDLF